MHDGRCLAIARKSTPAAIPAAIDTRWAQDSPPFSEAAAGDCFAALAEAPRRLEREPRPPRAITIMILFGLRTTP